MKQLLTFVFSLLSFTCIAQQADSINFAIHLDSIRNLVHDLSAEKSFKKVDALIAENEKKVLAIYDKNSAFYAEILFMKGYRSYYQGNFQEAIQFHAESKLIREMQLGKKHFKYGVSTSALGNCYLKMGNPEAAETAYLEAYAILQASPIGRKRQSYSGTIINLGISYIMQSRFEEGLPFLLSALAIQEKSTGKKHANYAGNLINIAHVYGALGQTREQEALLLEAKTIFEVELQNFKHPFYFVCLDLLAGFYTQIGNYEKAATIQNTSISTQNKVNGPSHPSLAPSFLKLAELYKANKQYRNAEQAYLQTKNILENADLTVHVQYMAMLWMLASVYIEMERYNEAEQLLDKAEEITITNLGKDNSELAFISYFQGTLYFKRGQYAKAIEALKYGSAIQEKLIGKIHPDFAKTLSLLATVYIHSNDKAAAAPVLLELAAINQKFLLQGFRHLSQQELNSYLKLFTVRQDQLLSFTQSYKQNIFVQLSYDNALFYKGFLLNAMQQTRRLAKSDSSSTLQFNRLKGYERRLSAALVQPIAEQDSNTVAGLRTKINDLEKQLVSHIDQFDKNIRQVKWQEVQQRLQEGEAAIEFVHFRSESDRVEYAALVLRPNEPAPHFIPLFYEEQLQQILSPQGKTKVEQINQHYSYSAGQQASLHQLLWQPLEELLANTQRIYYASSGLLHRLNLSALSTGPKAYLSDRHQLIQLGSTRQLLERAPASTSAIKSIEDALLFGGIQYEMDSSKIAQVSNYPGNSIRGAISFEETEAALRGGTWSFLDWTEVEVATIESLLKEGKVKTQIHLGYAASEEALKAISGQAPKLLHLATHGFFFPDPKVNSASANPHNSEPVFKRSEYPMIRSGLIMASANHAWKTGKPFKPNMEDGVLTADEISHLDLSNTELVVLSACDTGLGDIEGNEGVYGLQRAFKIAGVKNLIMSLWQVPDYQTQQLMTSFYAKWLEEEMSIPDAFRAAQREMRARYPEPFYWAGFVLVE